MISFVWASLDDIHPWYPLVLVWLNGFYGLFISDTGAVESIGSILIW